MNASLAGLRIAGGRVLTRDGWREADVELGAGTIATIHPHRGARPGVVDAAGLLVVPGFVDLQINGAFGVDLTSDPDRVWEVGERLPSTGVTAFLPTIVSAPPEVARRAMDVVASGPPDGYAGATVLGWHLEGPLLSPARHGAHDARHLRAPSLEVVEGWSREAGVRLVTLAPELEGATRVIRELRERGVIVSIGHSDATFEESLEAFDDGVAAGTHLFNAMSGLHHRAPGVVGALLARPDVVAGLVVDGIHAHPGAVQAAWRAKGTGGIALVTDAVSAMGAEPGVPLSLGGSALVADSTGVRDRKGRIAGSVLTLDRAVRNLVAFAGAGPEEAVAAASATPARLLGEDVRGSIVPGAAADLIVLDAGLEVVATIVGGRVVFDRRVDGVAP